jgi:hypothetical protein
MKTDRLFFLLNAPFEEVPLMSSANVTEINHFPFEDEVYLDKKEIADIIRDGQTYKEISNKLDSLTDKDRERYIITKLLAPCERASIVSNAAMLIDCGNTEDSDKLLTKIVKYGRRRLNALVETYRFVDIHLYDFGLNLDAILLPMGIDIIKLENIAGIEIYHQHYRDGLIKIIGTASAVDYYLKDVAPPNEYENYPILKSLIGDDIGKYLLFCKTLNKDSDKAQLLDKITNNDLKGYYLQQIHQELKDNLILETGYRNFSKSWGTDVNPNIYRKYKDYK